ncbi:hypothetical protein KOY48_03920 [Candidatus Minimicrobia naudis]|uniref:Phenylalanine-tRNA ligase class II N-terminal domain-containing protein n=1 Tax=Candidatus Minimicrobia naudis TaxID=2841263 RepID=A0A8F1SBK6_9BACT|nr:hypothetical protein KOY48_03920 [Candidatus Minimicrobia naudis]
MVLLRRCRAEERGAFGKKVNELKQELERLVTAREDELS